MSKPMLDPARGSIVFPNPSRRNFVKLSAAGALSLLFGSVTLTSDQALADAASTPSYVAGTYTATAEGKNAPFPVEVTFTEDAIESVVIPESSETPYIADSALSDMPALIVEYQSLGIDTLTGATITSAAILAAVEDCVNQAGGDAAALKAAPGPQLKSESVELDADLVVLGAGAAGIIAAVAAAQEGAGSVVVLEKTSGFGGNLSASGGYLEYPCIPEEFRPEMTDGLREHFQKILSNAEAAGIDAELLDSIRADYDAYYANGGTKVFDSPDFFAVSDSLNTGRTVDQSRAVFENETALGEWLTENGFNWTECFTIAGISWPRYSTSADAPAQGRAFCDVAVNAAESESLPITLLTATPAEELIIEDGTVVGVRATCDDGTSYAVRGTCGVVIATGGYAGNPDMIKQYDETWDFDPDQDIPTENNYGHTGDGLVMALSAGAQTDGLGNTMLMPYSTPGIYSLHTLIGDSGNGLLVNKEGKRYVDECSDRYTLSGAIMQQTDEIVYIISDAKAAEGGVNGFGASIDVILDRGYGFTADTIEELAEKVGIDPQALAETVETYNEYARAGSDPDFGRVSFNEDSPVETAPFYASPNTWAAHITMGGVVIDEGYRVLNEDGEPIEGLYAAGEMVTSHGGISVMSDGLMAARAIFGGQA